MTDLSADKLSLAMWCGAHSICVCALGWGSASGRLLHVSDTLQSWCTHSLFNEIETLVVSNCSKGHVVVISIVSPL